MNERNILKGNLSILACLITLALISQGCGKAPQAPEAEKEIPSAKDWRVIKKVEKIPTPEYPMHATLSPDEKKIAFTSGPYRAPGYRVLYVINTDGTNLRKLTDEMECWDPAWSPNGTKIVFKAVNDIWVINADGTNLIRLTKGLSAGGPAWSSDGKKIAFSNTMRREQYDDYINDIWIMNADGTGRFQLTKNEYGNTDPVWSPDGTRIAFQSKRNGKEVTCVINSDGTNLVQLPDYLVDAGIPVWNPDGSKIFLETYSKYATYVVNSDGTGITKLEPGQYPAWFPDGKKIVYADRTAIYILTLGTKKAKANE